MPFLNSKKIDEYCTQLFTVLTDEQTALEAFNWTITIIDLALKKSGQTAGDAVRLRAFTSELLEIGQQNQKKTKETGEAKVERRKGSVIWFSDTKGYGFIKGEEDEDIFVHYTDLNVCGFKTLAEAEEVDYTIIKTSQGLRAKDVKKITYS